MGRFLSAVVMMSVLATPVVAQPVDGKTAQRALFSTKGVGIALFNLPQLSEQDRLILTEVARQQKYYGAVAISPDEGLMSEATLAAANYHTIAPAEVAAKAACDKARKKGSARCVIAAYILPSKHTQRALQLSVDATQGFNDNWAGPGPKALAISPATGEWAMAKGQGAGDVATSDCNRTAQTRGAQDCVVVIAE